MRLTFNFLRFSTLIAVLFICVTATLAQTTAFTYQGRFTDSTLPQPTNGSYEMQYKLFDASTVGTGSQVATTQTISSVQVVNGIFTVQIDFGGTVFRSVDIFVEIGVRPVGSVATFTVLAPRQQITTAPLAIRSRVSNKADDADALGGVPANQYVQTTDSRLADDRNPTAGSPNYIQNQAATAEVRNEKITGETATLEYLDETGKWKVMDFIKEGSDWKMTIPDAKTSTNTKPTEKIYDNSTNKN